MSQEYETLQKSFYASKRRRIWILGNSILMTFCGKNDPGAVEFVEARPKKVKT